MMDTFEALNKKNSVSDLKDLDFVVNIDGFEGPIDVLLTLARDQKVDITQISILQLADQYLEFIKRASSHDLELAADYLVMAAWLAFLKSRILLPDLEGEDEPSGEEMAMALAFQLKRLESIQRVALKLMSRDQLGHDFFGRGVPERFKSTQFSLVDLSLIDLLEAYTSSCKNSEDDILLIEALNLYSVDDALARLNQIIGKMPNWTTLTEFLPEELKGGLNYRSAVASTLVASLEMVREGKLEIHQKSQFDTLFLRSPKTDLEKKPIEFKEIKQGEDEVRDNN